MNLAIHRSPKCLKVGDKIGLVHYNDVEFGFVVIKVSSTGIVNLSHPNYELNLRYNVNGKNLKCLMGVPMKFIMDTPKNRKIVENYHREQWIYSHFTEMGRAMFQDMPDDLKKNFVKWIGTRYTS